MTTSNRRIQRAGWNIGASGGTSVRRRRNARSLGLQFGWPGIGSLKGKDPDQMRTLAYLSGPPCSGKSAVAKGVQMSVRGIQYVRGDDYWNMYPDLSFEERVAATNRHILSAVRNSRAQDIVCEWVPWQGRFVNDLHEISVTTMRQFLQVVLMAPLAVLKRRKLERDGDEEIGPEFIVGPLRHEMYTQLLFDTNRVEVAIVADQVFNWIQLQNET